MTSGKGLDITIITSSKKSTVGDDVNVSCHEMTNTRIQRGPEIQKGHKLQSRFQGYMGYTDSKTRYTDSKTGAELQV